MSAVPKYKLNRSQLARAYSAIEDVCNDPDRAAFAIVGMTDDLAKLRASWADVEWWEIEGMQEHMLEHGLIKKYSPVSPCGSECGCADTYGTLKDGTFDSKDAVTCYRRTALLTGRLTDLARQTDCYVRLSSAAHAGNAPPKRTSTNNRGANVRIQRLNNHAPARHHPAAVGLGAEAVCG